MRSRIIISVRLVFIGFIIAGLSIAVSAQFRASLQGTVTDSTDAVVVGANVVLTNPATNQSLTAQTNESGVYRFNSLAPGNYNITVTQTGFNKKEIESYPIAAETAQGLDIKLETGTVAAEVTVDGTETPALNTEGGNIGAVISEREVLNLPQAGRDPYQLARLAPGVMGDGGRTAGGGSLRLGNNGSGPGGSANGIFATENQTQITANGQRVTSNNYEIDGTSVNSQTWGGAAVITPSQESVEAVQVTSSTYSAEDGRNSGAQVKVVTKGGSNIWHGSAFFKINDPSLNAYNKFYGVRDGATVIVPANQTRVQDKLKTYGGSFGGRIVRDKLFFFFSYEGARTDSNNTYNAVIDTATFRQSIISGRSGTISARLLAAGAEPRVVAILAPDCSRVVGDCRVVPGIGMDVGSLTGSYGTYVSPGFGGGFDGVADLQYAQLVNPYRFRGNQYNLRLDFLPTQSDRLTFTSNLTPSNSTTSDTSAQSRPQADINSKRLNYAFAGIYAHTFSANVLNEFRVNLTRFGYNELNSNPDADFGLPRVEIEGLLTDGRLRYGINRSEATPGIFDEKQLHFKDTLTSIIGNHNVKFGGEYRIDLNGNSAAGGARPLYSFVRPWNFANGTPIFEAINTDANGVPLANDVKIRSGGMAAFVQDDWKVRQNLTLNLGLRWEYFAPITPSGDELLGNLVLGSNGLANATIQTAKTLTKKDWNNFAPQLGFAWSPRMFKDKMVIRGGGGLGYDRLAFALTQNTRFNPPNAARFNICCGTASSPFAGGQIQYVASTDGTIYSYPRNPNIGGGGFGANGGPLAGSVEIYGLQPDLPTAHVYRYSLETEYQLPARFVATLGYQGSLGRNFVRIVPLHIIEPATNATFNPVYYGVPDVNSSYNAMNATIRRRFANDFDFNINYRWSKSLDTTSLEAPCGCTNQTYPVDLRTEKGPSDFDVTHFIVGSGTWQPSWFRGQNNIKGDLLSGWSFSPIVTWRSGFPWTPVLSQSLRGPNGNFFGPIRPIRYLGGEPLTGTNDNFLQPQGIFPGGSLAYFSTTVNVDGTGTPTYQLNPPGIGRNVFRGPKYFSVDLAIAKNFSLSKIGGLFKEGAALDLRFNFFNLLNTLNLAPFGFNSDSTRINNGTAANPRFGVATGALAGRTGEFQVRLSF